MTSFVIRDAVERDAEVIVQLIKELADFEVMGDQVKMTADQLVTFGISPKCAKKWFHVKVATTEGKMVGYAVYFFKSDIINQTNIIYMEDLFVKPTQRGNGIGKALIDAVADHGLEIKCTKMQFAVLGWNPAIDFYKGVLGAVNCTENDGTRMYRLKQKDIERLAKM